VRVSREFKANFDTVARYYGLADLGELEEAKEAARRDPEAAATCFAALVVWVRLQASDAPYISRLPTITPEEIYAKTSRINQAGKGR
jgi:hypothetical protein